MVGEKMNKRLIYTIGFENKSQEEFLHQLMRNGVGLVIDVRLNNCSEKDGYATFPTISNLLEHESIIYKNDRMLAPDDQIRQNYKRNADWTEYTGGFHKLMAQRNIHIYIRQNYLQEESVICLMCKEADSTACHRSLVAQYFASVLDADVINL